MLERMQNPRDEVDIALVGKYVEYEDSYKSLKEALLHGGIAHNVKVNIHWIEAESFEKGTLERELEDFDGILVPGGFGKRGIEGMINAIEYARVQQVPYFGICLGMQTMVIEFARNVCGLAEADSTEFDPATPQRVIYKLRELKGIDELGGTMRLGAWPCHLKPGSFAYKAYGTLDHQRTAPAPLRVQPRIRAGPDGKRAEDHRRDAGRHLRRNLRDRGPSVLSRLPVPSRVQIQAAGAASAVQRLHRGRVPLPGAPRGRAARAAAARARIHGMKSDFTVAVSAG